MNRVKKSEWTLVGAGCAGRKSDIFGFRKLLTANSVYIMDSDKVISQLIAHFKEMIPLDDAQAQMIKSVFHVRKLKKREYLLRPGQVSAYMRYIALGSMRVFYPDDKGQEHTLQLGIENWWINDLYSFLSGKASKMFIQATEDTIVLQISKENLEVLYREIPPVSDFFRLKMQAAYVALQERTIESMSRDAYSRYTLFLSQYRQLEQRFPQYIIASFLGVTPEFLSHLRKNRRSSIS